MDPLDHLDPLPEGLRCGVCDEPVPVARIRLLARRDDLAFLEIDCAACSSATLGFVLDGRLDEAMPAAADRPPIDADDVLDMHQLLAGWQGDLAGLLDGPEPSVEAAPGQGGRRLRPAGSGR